MNFLCISACRIMMQARIVHWLTALFIFALALQSQALVGYDCTRGKPNITTVSLVDVGNCEMEQLQPESKTVYIQLLQKIEYEKIFIRQCRISGTQRIRKCGMFSHNADVDKGDFSFVKKISSDECSDLAHFGQFKYGQAIIAGIEVNKTTRQPATVVGILRDDGTCQGSVYVSEGHEYTGVAVTIDFKITVQEYFATLKRSSNEVLLPSGTICRFNIGRCLETDESHAFWQVIPTPPCNYEGYETLFQGFSTKVSENSSSNTEIYFANSTGNIQFGLAKTNTFTLCGYRIFGTEHPKLFILETSPDYLLPAKQRIDVENILLTAYFNTKFTYFARHVKTQLTDLYKDIIFHRCQMERQIIMNSLSLLAASPDEFALNVMKKPGFTAVAAGEVAHILQCQELTCKYRAAPDCYSEWPVVCDNVPMFLRPKTRILTTLGNPRDCNNVIPILFKIGNTWRSSPSAALHQEPIILHPMKSLTWKYEDVDGLMSDGIYTPEDLDRLHDHSVFPMEKPALLENIVRKLSNKPEHADAISLKNLLDEEAIREMAESSFARAWSGFLKFGAAAAGFIAIFIILQTIKACIDTLIHGYALYTVYGWSIHLLGAVWSSITHLLLYLASPTRKTSEQDIELGNTSLPSENRNISAKPAEEREALVTPIETRNAASVPERERENDAAPVAEQKTASSSKRSLAVYKTLPARKTGASRARSSENIADAHTRAKFLALRLQGISNSTKQGDNHQ